jgi:hypothetical protein
LVFPGVRPAWCAAAGTFYNGQSAARQRLAADSPETGRGLRLLIAEAPWTDERIMTDPLSSVAGMDPSSSISVAVARKALDAAKFEGAAAVSLIKAAAAVGERLQRSSGVALPGEPGSRLDTAG